MINFVKKSLLIAVVFIVVFAGFITANAENLKVNDYANLFTEDEIQRLTLSIEEIINKHNIDVVIVTTNDVEGKTSRDYADDFYDYNGYGLDELNSGLLFLINMEDREVYISTCGYVIDYFTDARIDSILDLVYEDLSKGKYYDSAKKFLDNVDYYMVKGKSNNQYRIDENGNIIKSPMTKREKINRIIISLFISIFAAAISCLIVVLRYKKTKQVSNESYVDKKSIFFTVKRDEFVSSHISKVKINKDNNGGGGSSIHQSSSGTSHGGGGRGF
jgi:uncharacterized protein